MIGNRYGFQPFPAQITAVEFEEYLRICKEEEIEKKEILSEWFWKDENKQPPEYVLQVLPYF